MTSHFGDRLYEAVKAKKTQLIVGLDPVYERLPGQIRVRGGAYNKFDASSEVEEIVDYCVQTLRIIAPMVPVVKINIAFFERYLWEGLEAYYSLIGEANELGLEVIGDVKRGDIGHTARMYADAHLKNSELAGLEAAAPDAITINGFAGDDGVRPFADAANEQGKGIFVWVRASNPSAAEIQDFCDSSGQRMFEKIAEIIGRIAEEEHRIGTRGYSNVGMVVGGTSGEVTTELRRRYDKVWFLVPGYGSQGASAEDCLRFCKADGTGALINSSRSIIYAYEKPKYLEQYGNDWKRCIEQSVIDAKVKLANAMQGQL